MMPRKTSCRAVSTLLEIGASRRFGARFSYLAHASSYSPRLTRKTLVISMVSMHSLRRDGIGVLSNGKCVGWLSVRAVVADTTPVSRSRRWILEL